MPILPKPKRTVTPFKDIDRQFDYGQARWKKLSKYFRMKNPLCVLCQAEGIVQASEVTDHIVPINKGGDPWAWSNLQAVCRHHNLSKAGKSK